MKSPRCAAGTLGATMACVAFAAWVSPQQAPGAAANTSARGKPARALPPIEAAIARHPFATKAARLAMRSTLEQKEGEEQLKQLLPTVHRDPGPYGMGWAMTDKEYWQRIPPAARAIPKDWSQLPLIRFTNTELGGVREIHLREGPDFDQWLLRDPLHDLIACLSVERSTRRVYFMEIAQDTAGRWQYHEAFDRCYVCHPSGPRVIRPFEEPFVDRKTLTRFNQRILSYGVCDFGDSINTSTRGQPLDNGACMRCHDGIRRGKLFAIHDPAIHFKTQQEQSMPPDRIQGR